MAGTSLSILLDLDGTVVDSKPGILSSCKAALEALGHPSDNLDIDGLIGPPLEEVLTDLLGRLGDDRVAEAVVAYRAHYGAAGLRETAAYPGLVAALDALVAMQATLYIATSKRRVFAVGILEHLGLMDRFAGVYGSEPGGALDRKADLIAHVLRRYGLAADQCLMVGDRRHDAEGAHSNNIAAVGVLWGYGDQAELEAAGVQYLAVEPAALIPIAETHARHPAAGASCAMGRRRSSTPQPKADLPKDP